MEEYTNHKPTVHGCHSKSVKIHLQYQYGNHSNNNLFTFNVSKKITTLCTGPFLKSGRILVQHCSTFVKTFFFLTQLFTRVK